MAEHQLLTGAAQQRVRSPVGGRVADFRLFVPIAQLAVTGCRGTNRSLTAEHGADAVDSLVQAGKPLTRVHPRPIGGRKPDFKGWFCPSAYYLYTERRLGGGDAWAQLLARGS